MRDKEKITPTNVKSIPFEETLVYKILKERWSGQDIEQYFFDKSNENLRKLKKELKS